MDKIQIENDIHCFPMPVTLVGTRVRDKPNFMAVGWVTRVNHTPPYIAVGIYRKHHTPEGIKECKTFSVCFPGTDLLEKTDYCGMVSGRKADKSKLFDLFYGETKTAPMIKECPLCLDCRLVDIMALPSNYLFIGEIIGAYTEERFLTDGKPDIKKMKLFVLTMPDNNYWKIGAPAGKAFEAGEKLKK